MADKAAVFFDLDKTLIEGSSALHFARAAYKAGMLSRRQLAKDAWANIRFRLRGSTDEDTDHDETRRRWLSDHEGWAFTVVRRRNLYGQHQDCVEMMLRDFRRHVGAA